MEINWRAGIQEITRKQYYDMLNCLPPREPMNLIDGYTNQFLMGEPYTHVNLNDRYQPLYAQFGIKGKRYFYLGLGREKRFAGYTNNPYEYSENWETGRY